MTDFDHAEGHLTDEQRAQVHAAMTAQTKPDDDAIKQALREWFSPHHPDQGDFEARMRKAVEAYQVAAQEDWPEVMGSVQDKGGALICATIKCGGQEFRVLPEATAYARAIAACEAVDIVGADECIAAIRELAKEPK